MQILAKYLSIFLSWFINPDKAQESNTILYMQDAIKNQSTDILTGFDFFNNYLIYTQLYGISHSKLFLSCIWIITYIWSSMISLVFPTKIPIFRRKIPYELVVNYLKIELIPSNSTMPYALSFAIFHEFVSKHLSKKQIITKV